MRHRQLRPEFGPRFKSAILDTEGHTQRLYQVLLTNPELAKMIESEVMRSSYLAMREEPGRGELTPQRQLSIRWRRTIFVRRTHGLS